MNGADLIHNRMAARWKQQKPDLDNENKKLKAADGDVEDGPMPWWSGFIWVPLLLLALIFFVGLIYMVWSLFF